MFNRKFSRTLWLLPALGATLLFFNCRGGCGRHGDMDPHKRADKIVGRMEKELGLTTDQAARVKKLAYGIADSMQARWRGAMPVGAHGEMLKQLRAESVDTAALNKDMSDRAAEFQQRSAERHAMMIRTFVEFHDILTPEQRNKLAVFLEKHHEEMMEHWGPQ
jgi:Spy/CpxP family protein refolding chaperone